MNSGMFEAICRACEPSGCKFEYRGKMVNCPFKSNQEGVCEPNQFCTEEIISLFETIVMDNFYRKGKILP